MALVIGLVAMPISCGGDDEFTATSPDAADLRAVQVWDESAGLYSEGALSYIRIETAAGDELLEVELEPTDTGHEAIVTLDPGDYRFVSWQRPCDGSCDLLDPPTDRCEEQFSLVSKLPITATIEVRAGEGCTIDFE